ncbi:5890_t:CDS:2, partial [Entrophospora sp. SA101]
KNLQDDDNLQRLKYFTKDEKISINLEDGLSDRYYGQEKLELNKGIDELNNEIRIDQNMKKINKVFEDFKNNYQDPLAKGGIMDLTPKSHFSKKLHADLYKSFLLSLEHFDNLIPEETHDFLVKFFGQVKDMSYLQWSDAVDDLNPKSFKEDVTKMTIKIIKRTFDNFLQAFSLGHMNPLLNLETLEQPYLNDYVHPCLKSALWNCANVFYVYGEIPSIHHVKGQRGDGVGLTIDANKYEIAYMEGSRSAKVKNSKESDDRLKIAFNLRKMFFDIVNDRVEKRKIIVPEMKVFGDFTEIKEFMFFYEAIIKWALLVGKYQKTLSENSTKQSSRLSYGMNIRSLRGS